MPRHCDETVIGVTIIKTILFTLLHNTFRSMAVSDHGVKRTALVWHITENTYNQKENCAASSSCLVRFAIIPALGLCSYRPITPRIIQSNTNGAFFFLEHLANRRTSQAEESGILHFK